MIRRAAGAAIMSLAVAAACTPIEPVPLTNAPLNVCPCEGFAPGATAAARCRGGRCEIQTAANRPAFPFFVVVDVPTSSSYAPGATFVFYSDERGSPAFTAPLRVVTPGVPDKKCIAPSCLSLGEMTTATGSYRVTELRSLRAGFPLEERASIPVRVQYMQVGNAQFPLTTTAEPFDAATQRARAALFGGLPIRPVFALPQVGEEPGPTGPKQVATFAQGLPSGTYLRVLSPEAPFDALFPPRTDPAQSVSALTSFDQFVLDEATIDPADSRSVSVVREQGLDGWRVSVVDRASRRRISTVKTLRGTSTTVQLDTTGERRGANDVPTLGSDVDLILAPPDSFIGVPRYVSEVIGGALGTIRYPALPPPVKVEGVVAEPSVPGAQLLGYSAQVTFESEDIAVTATASEPLLHYTASVSTDDRGRFATVLPPGKYFVTIEPAEGTGFAKYQQRVLVDPERTVTALTLQPPRRTIVGGRVLLTDGRPLVEAEILATPQQELRPPATASAPAVKPRPGRTTTRLDGGFQVELDQGPYVITVIPKKGSGFPRVVTRPQIPANSAMLPDILVPPPTPLTFTLRDPLRGVENPVPNALIRVFAVPGVASGEDFKDATPDPAPVEIGMAVSGANGQVEILLAPGPR